MIGFLNINKPENVTSNYIVNNIKKKLKIKKVGHFGTLDPLASGVLPIAIGKATKLFDYFLNKEKVYIATFQFGYITDTLDIQGKTEQTTDKIPSRQELQEKLKEFIGKQDQIPPIFSAKNVNGVRAYDLARRGEKIELKPKEIEIYEIRLLESDNEKTEESTDTYRFYIRCSSGTYIRSIARDLGYKTGSLATMTGLIRQQSGIFGIEDAIKIEEIDDPENYIIPIEQIFADKPKIYLGKESYKPLLNGMSVKYDNNGEKISEALIYSDNELFGLGMVENDILKIKINLKEN